MFHAFPMRALIAILATMISPMVAGQGSYPSKSIRLISPYAAGGSTTTVALLVSGMAAVALPYSRASIARRDGPQRPPPRRVNRPARSSR